jgi:hypothetical protein
MNVLQMKPIPLHSASIPRVTQPCTVCIVECIPVCLQVDGMDILTVREATKFAADWTRSGKVWPKYLQTYEGHLETDLWVGGLGV